MLIMTKLEGARYSFQKELEINLNFKICTLTLIHLLIGNAFFRTLTHYVDIEVTLN